MKKVILFILLPIIIALTSFAIWYRSLPKLSIYVKNGSSTLSYYEIDGVLYQIKSNGVYKTDVSGKNELILSKSQAENSIFISDEDKAIYVTEYGNDPQLYKYDLNGKFLSSVSLPYKKFSLFKSEGTKIIGEQQIDNQNNKIACYDLENNFKEIPIDPIEYDSDDISVVVLDSEIIEIFFKSSMIELIGINNNKLAYMKNFYHPEIFIIDLISKTETKINLYEYIGDSYYVTGKLHKDSIDFAVTNTSGFFFDKNNVDGNTSTLKYHNYDMLLSFDIDTSKMNDKYKLKRFERIICIGENKVITYYKGKYLTYSLDDWKVTNKQSASEIKEGGSYNFVACGDHIFVFDNGSDELLNKIPIN